MTREELLRRATSGEEELWWSYRFVEDVIRGTPEGPEGTKEELDQAAAFFVKLALADPKWAAETLEERGATGDRYAQLLSGERLARVLERVRCEPLREEALLRARLLIATAHWAALRSNEEILPKWQEAWSELLRVPEAERDKEWVRLALQPTARVAYEEYRRLAEARLARVRGFWRATFLIEAIPFAARHQDWPTFEAWARDYRQLPEALRQGHQLAVLINLEGLHALDEGRLADAEASMREVLKVAEGMQFLSNDDVSALPKRLRSEGLCLELCQAFAELVERRDWRRLEK